MAETKDPVLFCNLYPGVNLDGSITAPRIGLRLPFGLPDLQASAELASTCDGLSIFAGSITASMTAFFPAIRIADCLLKVIGIIQAIPDAIPPGTGLGALISKISEIGDCLTLMGEFSGVIPQPFCQFIFDLSNIYIKILDCLSGLAQVTIENDQQISVLSGSGDAQLQELSSCLTTQNNALKASLSAKFDSMKLVLTLLNTIIQALPPVAAIIGPIDPGTNDFTPEALETLRGVVVTIRDVAATCA